MYQHIEKHVIVCIEMISTWKILYKGCSQDANFEMSLNKQILTP